MPKSDILLRKLCDLEHSLRDFSIEALPAREAVVLQNSFFKFRKQIEIQILEIADEGTGMAAIHSTKKKDSHHLVSQDLILISNGLQLPLDNIIGCTYMLRESNLSREQTHYVEAIHAASDLLMDINDELYDSIVPQGLKGGRKTKSKYQRINKAMTVPHNYQTALSTHISGKKQKLDLNPVLEDCLGQVDLLEELIGLFKVNAIEFIGEVKLHLQNSDFKGIAFASHKIKNGLRMLHITELLTIAEQMDIQARTDRDIKHLRFLYGCFVTEYPIVEKQLEGAILKLKRN